MKIHILGASGFGVTTLGKALSANLNVPYFHSDDFYWKNLTHHLPLGVTNKKGKNWWMTPWQNIKTYFLYSEWVNNRPGRTMALGF